MLSPDCSRRLSRRRGLGRPRGWIGLGTPHRWASARWRREGSGILLALASLGLLLAVSGCASSPAETERAQAQATLTAEAEARVEEARLQDLNQQIAATAAAQGALIAGQDYRLGPGDVIRIEAPQLEEIGGLKVRISGRGTVTLPMLDEVEVGGRSARQAEELLVQRLRRYVHAPQVAVIIEERTSQEVNVLGAVARPGIYHIERPRTLFEMISMAGGLASNAGSTVGVRTQIPDPETGQPVPHNVIIDLRGLMTDPNAQVMAMRGGDTLYVPEAGTFFVEGAVARPGSYPLRDGMTLLKAIAVAGGTDWSAVRNNVRVLRHDGSGQPTELLVDFAAVRDKVAEDLLLEDGDVVVVDTNVPAKTAVIAYNQALRLLSLRWIWGMP